MTDPIEEVEKDYRDFLKIAERLENYVDSPAAWEEKYRFIFGHVSAKIRSLEIWFKWDDSHGSYEGSIRSYCQAVADKAQQIKLLLGLE